MSTTVHWNNQVVGRFLAVFRAYVGHGEWVTARELGLRVLPHLRSGRDPKLASEWSREVSRKLSNLQKTGRLIRRYAPNGREFEYGEPPITRAPEQA